MSFLITPSLAEKIRDSVRAQPLAPGEMRRITGLGRMFLTLPDTPTGDGYTECFRVRVDGVTHVIHAGTDHGSADAGSAGFARAGG